jgi:hypothetical protein
MCGRGKEGRFLNCGGEIGAGLFGRRTRAGMRWGRLVGLGGERRDEEGINRRNKRNKTVLTVGEVVKVEIKLKNFNFRDLRCG